MLKLQDYRVVFVAVGLVGVLLFASPSLGLILHFPSGEKFSELWILGPRHMAEDYPFNVKTNVSYLVYLGVGNHLGSSAYYGIYMKFRNQSDALANATAGTPSPVSPLCEYRAFVQDSNSWEVPLTFSFSSVSFSGNQSLVRSLRINDIALSIDKSALWDVENKGYYYQLFMELWIYNVESASFMFHGRFVGIWLNMTIAS